ncbi:MAG: response regulator [Candidatus Heimdallarchaeota archaeon]
MTKGSLMIVEDNRELSELYEEMFSRKGFIIICKIHNGKEAVDFYRETTQYPDVIIMDHRMPLKGGIAASREILQINPDQKIIFASADGSVRKQVAEMGILQFKKKPFTLLFLLQNIEKAILAPPSE